MSDSTFSFENNIGFHSAVLKNDRLISEEKD